MTSDVSLFCTLEAERNMERRPSIQPLWEAMRDDKASISISDASFRCGRISESISNEEIAYDLVSVADSSAENICNEAPAFLLSFLVMVVNGRVPVTVSYRSATYPRSA